MAKFTDDVRSSKDVALIGTHAAEALYPTLSAFHEVQGCALKRVSQFSAEGSLESLVLDFGPVFLEITANEDHDTIGLSVLPSEQLTIQRYEATGSQPWQEFIGRTFGWGWLIMNQQGYIDGVLLSFDGIDPQLLLNVIASSIKVSRIARVSP